MPASIHTLPSKNEQDICVTCGFCCDNTLFDHASASNTQGLPTKIAEQVYFSKGEKYFLFPCPYFNGCCTIYDHPKPTICSSFRCKLLRKFSKEEMTKMEAMAIIEKAKGFKSEINDLWNLFSKSKVLPYRQLLKFVNEREELDEPQFVLLKAKVNLLNILLVKHFKSSDLFNELIENSTDK